MADEAVRICRVALTRAKAMSDAHPWHGHDLVQVTKRH